MEIGLLLETRGGMTAGELARHFEVSVRTIRRDVDALAAAGVPVYADRGRHGGLRLLEGYRMRPPGLTADEAASLFLAAVPGAARDLGRAEELASAELKLMAGLPARLRPGAGTARERIHIDLPGWFGEEDHPVHLEALAEAVWRQQVVEIRYQRWRGEVTRSLEPLGLVLKGGAWYLAARVGADVRTYRVSRVLELRITDERFERPEAFDLAAFWQTSSADFVARLHPERANVRISPEGRRMLDGLFERSVREAIEATSGTPDADGWVVADMPVESFDDFWEGGLLRLGAQVEVLGPPALRARMAAVAASLADLYRRSP